MCYYSDCYVDFYKESFVKARKIHICCECQRRIQPTEYYRKVVGSWDGEFDSFKTCGLCLDLIERVRAIELANGCSVDESTPNMEELYEAAQAHGLISIWREGVRK